MKTGSMFQNITIKTLTTTVTGGDSVETWSAGDAVRANVEQVDGTRYLKENELIDRAVYKIELWDNDYSDNIKIEYSGLTLYPVRPLTKNADKSTRVVVKIIAATKV
jgi:head-tail adaptor